MICGIRASAACGSTYYETLGDALSDAHAGDTVTAFRDTASGTCYEIGEGITLLCKDTVFYATVLNYGVVEGGTFVGRVENYGTIEMAALSGMLVCYPGSQTLDCQLSGAARLYGGSISGGSLTSLNAELYPEAPIHSISLALLTTSFSDAPLTLINKSSYTLFTDFLHIPDGYAIFPITGEMIYTDTLSPNSSFILTEHIHTPASSYRYDAQIHYIACSVCNYRDPATVIPHRFDYTDLGNGAHRAHCRDCGYEAALSHRGGTATCQEPARCALCRAAYKEPDATAHAVSENGICTVCGFQYPAACGAVFYETLDAALTAASFGDTVTLLCDNTEVEITVKEGVTLDCGNHSLTGKITNRGHLCGGRFYGEVFNHGSIEDASLFGGLDNMGIILSAHLSCKVENKIDGKIYNTAAGDITPGDGFSIVSNGSVDCHHHFGGTASCSAKAICRLCGMGYGALRSHSFRTYHEDGNATCERDGTKTAICEHCDAQDRITIEGSRKPHSDANRDGRCDPCGLKIGAPITTAPTTSKSPTETPTPTTTLPVTTKAQPTTTEGPTAPTTSAITTTANAIPTGFKKLTWWHYAIIGLILGGITVLSIGKRD